MDMSTIRRSTMFLLFSAVVTGVTAFGNLSLAYPVVIPLQDMTQLKFKGDPCPANFYMQGDYCYVGTLEGISGSTSASGVFLSFTFRLSPLQMKQANDGDVAIYALKPASTVTASENAPCELEITYNYIDKVLTVTRSYYNADLHCLNSVSQSIQDELIPLPILVPSGNSTLDMHLRANIYLTDGFMWIEVLDRTRPWLTPVNSSPIYFGPGAMVYGSDNWTYTLTSSRGSPQADPVPRFWPGADDNAYYAVFTPPSLLQELNTRYSQLPTPPPLVDMPDGAHAILNQVAGLLLLQ